MMPVVAENHSVTVMPATSCTKHYVGRRWKPLRLQSMARRQLYFSQSTNYATRYVMATGHRATRLMVMN